MTPPGPLPADGLPAISVVILTHGRRDELLRSVESVLSQRPPPTDVIVVDNAGEDVGAELRSRFPGVAYLRLEENIGCAGRNAGVGAARGEIVVTLDNDVSFRDDRGLEAVADFFARHPGVDCVSFKVLKEDGTLSLRDWCHPCPHEDWPDREFATDHIAEGACAFRRQAFEDAGGYDGRLFIGHEGRDVALRLLGRGSTPWYSPRVQVTHRASPAARPGWRAFFFNTRNNLWVYYRHYPGLSALGRILFYSAMMAGYSVRSGQVGAYVRGMADGLRGLRQEERRPLGPEAWRRLKVIRSHRPSLLGKVAKHLSTRERYR